MCIKTKPFDTPQYLCAPNISVPHGFTTRCGGVSPAPYDSLNLGLHRGDDPENVAQNHARLAQALGYRTQELVMSHQTHTDCVRLVTRADARGIDHYDQPECDGLITCDPGTALFIFTADCTPILLCDPVTGAVGAVHAGWRGTAAQIAAKAVAKMTACFGCDPKNIRAAIGPNIGFCCFETDRDVPDAMRAAFGEEADGYILAKKDKFHVDLKGLNALSLKRAGVENIHLSDLCTVCRCDRFFSHRVTKGIRGSQGAVIVCPPKL